MDLPVCLISCASGLPHHEMEMVVVVQFLSGFVS